jgi:hypothetical protein
MKYLDDIEKFVKSSPDIENCGPAKLSSVKLGIACVISDYDYETTKKWLKHMQIRYCFGDTIEQ